MKVKKPTNIGSSRTAVSLVFEFGTFPQVLHDLVGISPWLFSFLCVLCVFTPTGTLQCTPLRVHCRVPEGVCAEE